MIIGAINQNKREDQLSQPIRALPALLCSLRSQQQGHGPAGTPEFPTRITLALYGTPVAESPTLLELVVVVTTCSFVIFRDLFVAGIQLGKAVHAAQPPAAGFVYIATSPLIAAVKIGGWTGSRDSLMRDIKSVYGPEADVVTKSVQDARSGMAMETMRLKFSHRNLSGLFVKQWWQDYVTALLQL